MPRYTARRLLAMVVVLVASSIIVFLMLHLAPGDPAEVLLGGHAASAHALDAIRAKYGLDKALPVQYWLWLTHLLHGDFGRSILGHDTVAHIVLPRLGNTLLLTLLATILMLAIGIPLGILSGVYRNGMIDTTSTLGALTFASVPSYVMGLVLIVVFGVELAWFPTLGSGEGQGLGQHLYHMTLPAIALAFSCLALISRITRSAMISELASEHVEAARLRGFSERRVVLKHAVRGALVPVVTITGALFGYLLAGAILVEYTFGINGVGSLLVTSVQGKDYAVVQAIALLVTAEFLIISFIVDLLYGVIDPRVRLTPQGAD